MRRSPAVLALLLALLAAAPAAAQTPDSTAADTLLTPDDLPAPDTAGVLVGDAALFEDPPNAARFTLPAAISAALRVSPEVGAAQGEADFAVARYGFARASRFLTDFRAQTAHAVAPGLRIPEDNTFPDDALYLNPDVRNDWSKLRPFNRLEIQATQPVLTWGELSGNLQAARAGARSEAAAVGVAENAVALRLAESYYGLLLARRLKGITDEAESLVARAKREVQALVEAGDSTVDQGDLYDVLLTEQEYTRRVVEVDERLATAGSALARQLFLPDGVPFAPADTVLEPLAFVRDSLGAYVRLAAQNRPELRQAREGVEAREALVRVARSDFYPKLGIGLSATYSYAAGRIRQPSPYIDDPFLGRSVRVGLGLRQNLNVLQTRARVAQAQAQANGVRATMRGAEQLVRFEVEEAYRNVVIAEAALRSGDESFRITRQWLLDEQINFDLELGDARALVRAVRARLLAEVAYYESIQRYNVAVVRLLARAGVLASRAAAAGAGGTLVE